MNPSATLTDLREIAGPVSRAERITSLDSLRGFALLGILLMNIVAMAMYGAAYDNPTVTGGATGVNLWVWAVLHVVAEGKMRAIFSLVFGAGVILLTSRLESTGRSSADIYYRRTLWLLLFGIAHAYLLWLGDILYPYALCALALYPFRKMPAKKLVRIGVIVLAVTAASYIAAGFKTRETIAKGRTAIAAAESGKTLTDDEKDARADYEKEMRFWSPTPEFLAKDAAEWRGNPLKVIGARAKIVGMFHSQPYYAPGAFDVWGMMLIGMGLMKLRVLGAERSAGFYAKLMLIGYGIGLPLNTYSAWAIIRSNFDPVQHFFLSTTYDLGRLTVSLGHIGLILLLCRKGWLKGLTNALGAVGQTALSNYIAQSVIAAFIFTGYGFRLYGQLQRYQIYYVVAGIWVFNLVASSIWVRHFRFGPMEWCWRSLTYWKKQPMRLAAEASMDGESAATAA